MAQILLERVTNPHGKSWIRTHGTGVEGSAFCSRTIHPDAEGIRLGLGQISCPDCIAVIQCGKAVSDEDITPEYYSELFKQRFKS